LKGLKTWLKELRAEFLPASILPVLVAGSLAYYEEGTFDAYLFSLTLLGVAFMHLGTNVANDYYDHISGNDILNKDYVRPFTGGSRLIQEGMISPRAVLATAVSFFAAATIVGIFLFLAFRLQGIWRVSHRIELRSSDNVRGVLRPNGHDHSVCFHRVAAPCISHKRCRNYK